MLETWLHPSSLASFRASHLHRAALARAGTTFGAAAILDWDRLGRMLGRPRRRARVLVVARGRHLPEPPPRSLAELASAMERGVGICLQHAEELDPGLAGLAAAFDTDLGAAQVQIFATPGATHGFGWHYDDEDVFVAQVAGVKDYYFRANTVAAGRPASPDAFTRFAAETAPILTATLVPGDFLYLPARWWHVALCRKRALSLSIGVVPRTRPVRSAPGHSASVASPCQTGTMSESDTPAIPRVTGGRAGRRLY